MRKDHYGKKIIDQVDHAAHNQAQKSVKDQGHQQVIGILFSFSLAPVHIDPSLIHFKFGLYNHNHPVKINFFPIE